MEHISSSAPESSQVRLPNAFFATAKRDYADWRWAFFRELVQNCFDAGARNIDFMIKEFDAACNSVTVRCDDDGCGMTRHVLENGLLSLGGSSKPAGAVGGFGIAKQLLFFAHQSYTISTGSHYVHGSGGQYTLQECAPVKGTAIAVWMEQESASVLCQTLRRYASFLSPTLNLRLTLNGEALGNALPISTTRHQQRSALCCSRTLNSRPRTWWWRYAGCRCLCIRSSRQASMRLPEC